MRQPRGSDTGLTRQLAEVVSRGFTLDRRIGGDNQLAYLAFGQPLVEAAKAEEPKAEEPKAEAAEAKPGDCDLRSWLVWLHLQRAELDQAVAALAAACVAEPVLASLGGGGFLLASPRGGETVLYDFFAQTPRRRRPEAELDFYPILADFGSAQQEFHIGAGSIATPGTVRGLIHCHSRLGSLPLREIVAPAIEYAKSGVAVNALQAYIFTILAAVYIQNSMASHDEH